MNSAKDRMIFPSGAIEIARHSVRVMLAGALLAIAANYATLAKAQDVYTAEQGGLTISTGAMASGSDVQYGSRKMIGVTGFADADTRRRFGVEAEGQWLEWRQSADVHLEIYSIGGRYHMDFGRWMPYAKGLIGFGDFNFPYNLATGRYLVITAGGGVDYRLTRRVSWRAADVEYQDWPYFTFANMNTVTVSTGLKVRIR